MFSRLINASKVKAKISKAVQKSPVKYTSQQISYLILTENTAKGAGIVLRWTKFKGNVTKLNYFHAHIVNMSF